MIIRACVAATAAFLVWVPIGSIAEDVRFMRIKGADISKVFAGREFSDEVHWTQRFERDGQMKGSSMGRKIEKRWLVKDDTLCLADAKGEDCREVWKAGNRVELRRWSDDELPDAGIMRGFTR